MIEFRKYHPEEMSAIERLFVNVFTDSESEEEGAMIGKLTKDLMNKTDAKDLYGITAQDQRQVIGTIFFSRLTFEEDINVWMLSPVAIDTNYQGKGVGQKLINHGLNVIANQGVKIVITYGDPAFYSKVGFSPLSTKTVQPPFKLSQPEGWLGQSLLGESIKAVSGVAKCVEAFNDPSYW